MPTGIELSAGIVVGAAKPIDAKFGPYASTAAALADIPAALRYKGLTVGIETSGQVAEYWFRSGTADSDFVLKNSSLITGTGVASMEVVTALPATPSPTTFYIVIPSGATTASAVTLGSVSLLSGSGSGGGGDTTFTPTSITGLQLWLDADDSTTLFDSTSGGAPVEANGSVARWEDKSGNGTHVIQSTVNSRPILKTLQKNGKSGIYFDGNDFLIKSKQLFATAVTVFAVAKFSNINERLAILDLGSATDNSLAFIEQNTYLSSGGKYGFYWSRSSNDTNIPTDLFEKIFSVSVNSTSGTNIVGSTLYRVNGVTATLTKTFGPDQHKDYTGVSGFIIGGYNSGGNGSPIPNNSAAMKGNIYEILVYNSYLSNSDRQKVENYLSTKWGIAI